uniref:uncharacterized protein LOC101297158 n=1 Tax=Fragaria vesca subsp. vesca TaxID=101020 RepID=UPI0005C923F7|nr:PREDICTED: uncharacterized protein LOC101297158 [Fragaria vesca subsp. vesca]
MIHNEKLFSLFYLIPYIRATDTYLSTFCSFVFQAIDLALNGKQHEFIEIGFQEGGLCSMYGIKKEQYCKRLKSLTRSVKGIRELTGCDDIYCSASVSIVTVML